MDAHALLTSQGWRGTGNSLHPTSNTIGLSRPLLVSKKQNTLGIGKKQHKTSDMWWMNAFDSSLKGLDTTKEGTVVQTVTSGGLDMVSKAGAKWVGSKGGLYASFVRGESLSGTITPVESTESEEPAKKKRRREVEMGEKEEESKEERRARKATKRAAKAAEDKSEESRESPDTKESKEERRARKAAKRALLEEEAKASESASTEDTAEQDSVKPETKEQRKERKRLKKLAQKAEQDTVDTEDSKKKKKKRRKEE
ncbi:uncharacterized protein LY89DRAFT_679688 [Mollisia scopiformis]|uniref:Uncharacterized protein n=1 Tax=Mollisia scopiformis TaxID=149040 RepID=A0A194XWS8_MOLSC|nr:uncharacterized protein LY89DRAFT_679688 [Mollisia scopiformis]KUJ24596.1 hypothetical protein LY89DRAFT_679688 [Mollisia scopiformis]